MSKKRQAHRPRRTARATHGTSAALPATSPLANDTRRDGLGAPAICALLAGMILLAYWTVLRWDFAGYDDTVYVTDNWHVLRGLSWEEVDWAFTNVSAGFWHPLTWLSHMLDCQLYGLHAWGHHLTSLLLHIGNTLLVFSVLRRMTGALWRSAVVAGLFALHPLHVEAVAWVAERKEVLSAFFGLWTLWAYGHYVAESKVQSPKARVFYILSVVFFAFALMSKPMVVTVPVMMLLLDYWPLRRFPASDLRRQAAVLWQLTWEKAPFFALAFAVGLLTIHAESAIGAVHIDRQLPLLTRSANAIVSYARYLGQTIWPVDLSVFYPYAKTFPASSVAPAALLLAGISVVAIWLARRRPYFAVGWFWFVIVLLPVSGLIQVGSHSRADRYTYVPLIGVFIIVVWLVSDWLARWRAPKLLAGILAAGVLAACGLRTHDQLRYWQNAETLFRHALAATQDNYLAYNNVGYYLMSNEGHLDEAINDFRRAIQINPQCADALDNLGYALSTRGQTTEAIAYYEAALQADPELFNAQNNLGNALSALGKSDEAVKHYQLALKLKPDYADTHNNLGIVLAQQGQFDEAMLQFHAAILYKPDFAIAHNSLANILVLRHQYEEALPEYAIALRLNPGYAEAHNNLGYALAGLGHFTNAVPHYEAALRLKPDYASAHFNLGCALEQLGQRNAALAQFTEALRLKPDYSDAKQKLKELSSPAAH